MSDVSPGDDEQPVNASADATADDDREFRPVLSAGGTLADAAWLARTRPRTVVPYVALAVLVAVVEVIRLRDPVPVAPTTTAGSVLDVSFRAYPDAVRSVTTPPAALVGLDPTWLLWTLGVGGLVVVATAAAAAATMVWALDRGSIVRSVPRLVAYHVGLLTTFGAMALLESELGLLGVVALVASLYVLIKLFLVPALLVWGRSVPAAVRTSWAQTGGNRLSLFGLVVLLGLASALLTSAPQLLAGLVGDEAIDLAVDAFEGCEAPGDSRHRVEHVELASDAVIERMADAGIVASCQPNFLRWAGEDGLYESRLGTERRRASNRFRTILDSGAPLAFGSDVMPIGPLEGVEHAVTAPAEGQRLSVTEALRAYTRGAAYAGFDEDRLGTVAVGKRADLVLLERSPWGVDPDAIGDIDVAATLVDGDVVYDALE